MKICHEICAYVEATYGKAYTVPGMQSWMHNHGFVYKNPKGIPAKASLEAQEKFIADYEDLMTATSFFLDLIIPCHRVINTNGDLGGYGGGIARKKWLINHEKQGVSIH